MSRISTNRQFALMVVGLAGLAYAVSAILAEPFAKAAERERAAAVSRLQRAHTSAGAFFTAHEVGTSDAWWKDGARRKPKHPAERAAELRADFESLSAEVAALTERVAYEPAPPFQLPTDFAAYVRQQTGRDPEPGDYQAFVDAVRDRVIRTPMGESPAYAFARLPLASPTIEGPNGGLNFGAVLESIAEPRDPTDVAAALAVARDRAAMRLTLMNIAVSVIEAAREARVASIQSIAFTPPGSLGPRYKSDTSRRYRPLVLRIELTADETSLLDFLVQVLRPVVNGHAGQALTIEQFEMDAPDALSDTPGADRVTATLTLVAMRIDRDAPFVTPAADGEPRRGRAPVRRRGFW